MHQTYIDVGTMLSQPSKDIDIHPVTYFSKKLPSQEEKYVTIEKEYLGVKVGVEAFQFYLMECTFINQTDHRSLIWLDR